MPSIGAKLAATTMTVSGLAIAACAGLDQPRANLDNAPATQAMLERVAQERRQAPVRLAEQAEAARLGGDFVSAVALAEDAVVMAPSNTAARRTLAQSYFALGRFESSRQAYADLIAMEPHDSGHKFGAAVAALALGDEADARALVAQVANDPSKAADVGLAYVLLGEPERGISVLTGVVRSGESTARARQNLALAQALSGRWNEARVTAAIDLDPAGVEARVAEWAALMASENSAWRTVSLLKINPVPADAGRPVQLAWNPPQAPVMQAVAEPAQPNDAEAVALASADPAAAEPAAAEPAVREVDVAAVDGASAVQGSAPTLPARFVPANAVTVSPRAPALDLGQKEQGSATADPAPVSKAEAKPAAKPEAVTLPEATGGNWLVQLGSYDREEYVVENWDVLKARTDFLADYSPVRSRAEVDGRTYYRLSVGRFATSGEAQELCTAVKAAGESCFIREGKFQG